ncbi:MAG: hypothetical protein KA419_10030 [Acidobacteria bacterium]|nr:hypothetical protein [Acidobacteriota bacterium]
MTHLSRRMFVLGVALLVIPAGCGKKEKVSLGFKPVPGKVYTFRSTHALVADVGAQGDSRRLEQSVTLRFRFVVEGQDAAGARTARVTWTGVSFTQKTPVGTFRFDSAAPGGEAPPPAKPWAALTGESVVLKIGPDGKIAAVEGAERLRASLLAKLGIEPTPEAMAMTGRQFSAEALREQFERLFDFLPPGAVGEGDRWTRESVQGQGYPMKLNDTLTLQSVGEGKATLALASVVTPNPAAPPLDADGQEIRFEFKGEATGTLEVDLSDGLPRSATGRMTVSGYQRVNDRASGKNFAFPTNLTLQTEVLREP